MLSAAKTSAPSWMLQLLSLTLLTGCSGLGRTHREIALLGVVQQAYRHEQNVPQSSLYSRHFERGWKQAYYDVSRGADGCPPSVPPEMYWSVKYQNADGGRKIASWFEGYKRGVCAAQRDCRPLYSDVPQGEICYRDTGECNPVEPVRHGPGEVFEPMMSAADTEIISPAMPQLGRSLGAPGEYVPDMTQTSPIRFDRLAGDEGTESAAIPWSPFDSSHSTQASFLARLPAQESR